MTVSWGSKDMVSSFMVLSMHLRAVSCAHFTKAVL